MWKKNWIDNGCVSLAFKYIFKFFRLVINGVYIYGSVLVASLVGKTRQLLQEANGCRRYMGQDMTKGTLWFCPSKI